jgi:tetratricopeptide (TPR) repeat protein
MVRMFGNHRFVCIAIFMIALSAMHHEDAAAFQRGGRGGGGGARPSMGGGGMGGARPNMGGARPNMGGMSARPSMPQSRPAPMQQMPSARPSFGNASRPSMPSGQMQRPMNMGGNQLSPQSRPNPGLQQRPNIGTNRPSLGGVGGGVPSNRPAPGNLGNTLPSNRPNLQMPSMPSANRPRPMPGDSGLTTRPGNGMNRPNAGVDRPRPLPGDVGGTGGNRPNIGNPNRPGLGGDRPGLGGPNRPGFGGDRPNIGDRPNLGGGNRPTTLPGDLSRPPNRPDFGNRPTTKPAPPTIGGNRPGRPGQGGQGNFPGINNRPGAGGGGINNGITNRPNGNWGNGNWNRPDWNRPDWGNGNNNWGIGNGNWGNNNNFNNININNNNWNNWTNNNFNRPAWDRPGWGNTWGNGWGAGNNWQNSWHNHCIHPHYNGWYNGSWGYWGSSWYSPMVWGATGWGLGAWSSSVWNTANFINPYYVTPAVNVTASVPYDYSQPVVVNNYITSDSTSNGADAYASNSTAPRVAPQAEESFSDFDVGLDSFKNGDYAAALASFDAALRKNGGDPVVHEVRALTLFALGNYNEAAVALNSLLASAPGMDWTTLSSMYSDTDVYTGQLRKLEAYCKANPKNPASAFVLAYHYLVTGSKDSAVRALRVVVENQPKDVVAKRMLAALDPKPPQSDPASTPAAPAPSEELAKPQPEINLVGKWKAVNGPSTVEVAITDESAFTWNVMEGGKKVAELSGDFATNGDAVVFDTKEQGSLGGTVKVLSSDEWVMVPPGATKEEAGIRFKRAP